MPLLEQQNVLAKIYTDETFRSEFLSEPEQIGLQNGLSKEESVEISRIMPAELKFFADSLFYKRLNEVIKILQISQKSIGKREFERFFREFANEFKPTKAKKHLEDSFEFCKFLLKQKLKSDWLREIIILEKARLQFYGYGQMFVFRAFRYNLARLQNPQDVRRSYWKSLTFAIWIRFGKKTWHRFF
jgi:hypothetical protein